MTTPTTPGLHHVTAIAGLAQANVDFYTRRLGQRLVKRTVNFDDPGTYHLYYGDRTGGPGSVLTFFPYATARRGRAGYGMAESFAYDIPAESLDDQAAALRAQGVTVLPEEERFGARVLPLVDPDGLKVELVASATGTSEGFHSATLWLRDPEATARILTEGLGYREAGQESGGARERLRFVATPGPDGPARGAIIDLLRVDGAPAARPGAGTIHHIAFRATDDAAQEALRSRLGAMGQQVTPQIDRQYFNAIYFREPGGILFEIATDPPGFTVDEPIEMLGQGLMLPPQYESRRAEITAHLPPLVLPA
ncbi:ring-cleaving dioxygenase [Plastorhodobacter daqingensis]|uniref:Ring-cleaving dioxygenase n=1 Tax=Plastorhodobacter daqingensis TaxID=1387281 RepID=A0ABW2UMZ1_9RHOB